MAMQSADVMVEVRRYVADTSKRVAGCFRYLNATAPNGYRKFFSSLAQHTFVHSVSSGGSEVYKRHPLPGCFRSLNATAPNGYRKIFSSLTKNAVVFTENERR